MSVHPFITGGSEAQPNEYPYQVRVIYRSIDNEMFLCGGIIINSLFILTAAHCIFNKTSNSAHDAGRITVTAGDHHLWKNETFEQIRKVEKLFIHEDYNPITIESDIGLMALSSRLKLNEKVSAIDFPKSKTTFSGVARISGWGRTGHNRPVSDTLHVVSVPIVPLEECRNTYANINATVVDSMLCAGTIGKNSCKGDSGGPLVCKIEENGNIKDILCGLVSFGVGCGGGQYGYPRVYTDVSFFSHWIRQTIKTYQLQSTIGKCTRNEFYCPEDNFCISRQMLCNNRWDCSEGSDETSCRPELLKSQFKCDVGGVIDASKVCDGFNNCGDNSDEQKCTYANSNGVCPLENEFICKSDTRCIPNDWKCDRRSDCEDDSDEIDCFYEDKPVKQVSPCGSEEFQCSENPLVCIPKEWKCDDVEDCDLGVDEVNCNASENEV